MPAFALAGRLLLGHIDTRKGFEETVIFSITKDSRVNRIWNIVWEIQVLDRELNPAVLAFYLPRLSLLHFPSAKEGRKRQPEWRIPQEASPILDLLNQTRMTFLDRKFIHLPWDPLPVPANLSMDINRGRDRKWTAPPPCWSCSALCSFSLYLYVFQHRHDSSLSPISLMATCPHLHCQSLKLLLPLPPCLTQIRIQATIIIYTTFHKLPAHICKYNK